MRLVPANIAIEFELDSEKNKKFLKEFNTITYNEEDQLGAWLKRAKAKGETKDSDQVLLTLIIELHRKIDELNATIKNEKREIIKLKNSAMIDSIGFDGFKIDTMKFVPNEIYYARLDMPIFPRRIMAVYLKAISQNEAIFERMHDYDQSDYDAYVMARERVMIRAKKER